jgi:hypothetical protein
MCRAWRCCRAPHRVPHAVFGIVTARRPGRHYRVQSFAALLPRSVWQRYHAVFPLRCCRAQSLAALLRSVLALLHTVCRAWRCCRASSLWQNQHSTFIPSVGGDLASYTASLLAAVRRQDEDVQVYNAAGARGWHDAARHTVARHGQVNVLWYLVEEANVSLQRLTWHRNTVVGAWHSYRAQRLVSIWCAELGVVTVPSPWRCYCGDATVCSCR